MKRYIVSHKKKIISSVLLVTLLLLLMCLADNKQQQRMFKCREGYRLMQEKNYREALGNFHEYYDDQSELYWEASQILQGESYHRQNVEDAMQICEEYLNHHYQAD